jgi:hypothetical protein
MTWFQRTLFDMDRTAIPPMLMGGGGTSATGRGATLVSEAGTSAVVTAASVATSVAVLTAATVAAAAEGVLVEARFPSRQ